MAPFFRCALAVPLLFSFPALAQDPAPSAPTATAQAAAVTPVPPATTGPTPALVSLKDGQQLRGTLVGRDASGITLELEGGARMVVPEASIARIEVGRPGQGAVRGEDPNRTRYLYSPSGFMLRTGEGYVSQTELLVTSVAIGVTEFLTVGVGTSVPFLFVDDGVNVLGMVKVGGSVGEHVHVAAVGQTLWLPGVDAGTTGGLLLATVTFGTPDAHVGFSAGPPFVTGTEENAVGDVLLSISGNYRVSERIALVSENWILPAADNAYITSGALRFIGQRLSVDAGLVFVDGATVPLPWLDFTFNFGR